MVWSSSTLSEVWVTAILIMLFGVFSQNVSAQQPSEPVMRTIYPCKIKSTARGAEFAFTYSYWVTADEGGKLIRVTPFKSEGRAAASRFVDENVFVECVRKWTLEPNGKYIVQFRVATMSRGTASKPLNYVMILGPGESGQKLKVALDWSAEDTLVEQKIDTKPVKLRPKHKKSVMKR